MSSTRKPEGTGGCLLAAVPELCGEEAGPDAEAVSLSLRFSDDQLSRIRDEAMVYQCACPAQVAEALQKLRRLHEYQLNCLTLGDGSDPPAGTGETTHRAIALAVARAHQTMEKCLDEVLEFEGWDRDTLRMPEGLRKRRDVLLDADLP